MGFADLALVAPRDPRVLGRNKTVQRASGARDVLRRARVCADLAEAVADRDVVAGTRMPVAMGRARGPVPREYREPRDFFAALAAEERGEDLRLALVFGSELTGERRTRAATTRRRRGCPPSCPRRPSDAPCDDRPPAVPDCHAQAWPTTTWTGATRCWASRPIRPSAP